ncbi:4Fe-4S binding protein [Thermoproteota archaeon]
MSSIFFNTIKKISSHQLNEISITSNRCIDERCKTKKLCNICQDNCVVDAINIDKKVEIDWSKCIRCGVCAAVCPTEVFEIQAPSDNKILTSIIGSSKDEYTVIECNFVNKKYHGNEKRLKNKGQKITVNCIGRFSEMFLLQSILARGDRVNFVNCTSDCSFVIGRKVIDEIWRRTDYFLKLFEKTSTIKKENIRSIKDYNKQRRNVREIEIQDLSILLSQNRSSTKPSSVNKKMPPRRVEILELIGSYSGSSIRINRKKMPFAEIKVSIEKCKLHGICASVCPTDALNFLESNQGVELNFRYGLCVGCGACTYICPEKALGIEKTIDLSQLTLKHKTIMEKKYLLCKSCGKHFSVKTGMNSSVCGFCIKRESSIEEYARE